MTEKQLLTESLRRFIAQRAGMDWRNYGSVHAYRAEQRAVTKDRHHAEALLAFVERSPSVTAELIKSSLHAYSGRLSWDYVTGQYFPTEYRKAVCACLAQSLWHWFREDCGCDTSEKIRAAARRSFGRHIADRWFN
jgi:hypothetical protein